MTQQDKNYYFGIDLGTTNSVMAWGQINPRTNQFETKVVPVSMIHDRRLIRDDLLPSCVYFDGKGEPIVGIEAKKRAGKTENAVASSKSHIGSATTYMLGGKKHSPTDVAALILKHLANSAYHLFKFVPDDVVITVPASFDSDMRQATIEAASQVGFRVTEDDPSVPRNILLNEPQAALYDFINRLEKGEIPDALIDFSQTKTVLVFDLGGGTLDISLHKVTKSQQDLYAQIEDLALSPYTPIGGDNFDFHLADFFLREFHSQTTLNLNSAQEADLRGTFLQIAEEAKIELSTQIDQRRLGGRPDADLSDIGIDVIRPFVHENKSFDSYLDLAAYKEAVSGLLGLHLTKESLQNFDSLRDTDNIIYPILDVLQKATDQLGYTPEVDAVLLNGGMTKMHTIQERLHEFFGFKPIAAGDPDKAVARGAVVYHYLRHQGLGQSNILNNTIGLETEGGFVRHLVKAGTVLPSKPVLHKFSNGVAGTSSIDLPFYEGRREDTQHPNRKIVTRQVHFDRPLPLGEPVCMSVQVDERNILTGKVWLERKPDQKFEIEVATNLHEEDLAVPGLEAIHRPKPAAKPTGAALDVNETLDSFYTYVSSYTETNNAKIRNFVMNQLKSLERKIKNTTNGKSYILPLLEGIDDAEEFGKSRILHLLGHLGERNPCDELALVCEKAIELTELYTLGKSDASYLTNVANPAIGVLGRLGLQMAETHLLQLLGSDNLGIRLNALLALGRVARSQNTIRHIRPFLSSDKHSERMNTYWSLGRIGSREKEPCLPIAYFDSIMPLLQANLHTETHHETLEKLIYAIGEIGDRRNSDVPVITSSLASSLLADLNQIMIKYKSSYTLNLFASTAIAMIGGNKLSEEQSRSLLRVRSTLSSEAS